MIIPARDIQLGDKVIRHGKPPLVATAVFGKNAHPAQYITVYEPGKSLEHFAPQMNVEVERNGNE